MFRPSGGDGEEGDEVLSWAKVEGPATPAAISDIVPSWNAATKETTAEPAFISFICTLPICRKMTIIPYLLEDRVHVRFWFWLSFFEISFAVRCEIILEMVALPAGRPFMLTARIGRVTLFATPEACSGTRLYSST